MSDDARLAISLTRPDGSVKRLGPEEFAASDRPTGIVITTSIPGGYKTAQSNLLRDFLLEQPDLNLFGDVKIYQPGGKSVFEGRAAQFPAERAAAETIQIAAIGHAAHLEDDNSFREVYVGIDKTRWRGPGTQRKLNLVAGTYGPVDPTVARDDITGLPSLAMEVTGAWAAGGLAQCEAIYDAGGIPLGDVQGAWKKNALISAADTNWNWLLALSDDDIWTSFDQTANLRATGPGTSTLSATTAGRKYAAIFFSYPAAAGVANNVYGIYWTSLAVYGRHGLTKQGTIGSNTAPGILDSDIVKDVIARAAPNLTTNGVEVGNFIVPNAEYIDPTTALDVVEDINKYSLREHGVYDDKDFFWRSPDPARCTWRASLAAGAKPSPTGDDAASIFNGVVVKFTDPVGRAMTVGPPGTTVDLTDVSLVDTSSTNPVNQNLGLPRYAVIQVSTVTTPAGAIQLGNVWLREHSIPQRRGTLTVTGRIDHPTMGSRPVAEVKAGDYVTIYERPDDEPRRIIGTTYTHDTRELVMDLDNTVFKLDAILERLGIGIIGIL